MVSVPGAIDRDVHLSDRDFVRIAALVHDMAGIVLADAKRPLVHSRLMRRLQALHLTDFSSYADYVSRDGHEEERLELISAVTTNVTSFFREQHHFDTLSAKVLPVLIERAKSGGRVRFWSAGCSSGEEPYSLAATVLAACAEAVRLDLRILATDIDRGMVDRTRRAVYPAEAVAGLPPDMKRRMFPDMTGGADIPLADAVRRLVTCNPLNLMDEWPFRGPFDVIFCRNVVIYFDKVTQERLWQRFAALLPSGGYLMIGHSERITGPALADFDADGITSYRRR